MRRAALAAAAALLLPALASARPGQALLERASREADKNDLKGAVRDFEAAIKGGSHEYWAYVRLGQCYAALGRLEQARSTLRRARELDPRQADAYISLGYVDLNSGNGVQAERDLRQLIAVDSANPAGFHHLGSVLAAEGRLAEAETNFREAARRLASRPAGDWERLHAIDWLGGVQLAQGELPAAERTFRGGLQIAGSNLDFRGEFLAALGRTLAKEGRGARASSYLEQAGRACARRESCPVYGPQVFFDLAKDRAGRGDRRGAARLAREALDRERRGPMAGQAALAPKGLAEQIQAFLNLVR